MRIIHGDRMLNLLEAMEAADILLLLAASPDKTKKKVSFKEPLFVEQPFSTMRSSKKVKPLIFSALKGPLKSCLKKPYAPDKCSQLIKLKPV
jgi:hypothetical protein